MTINTKEKKRDELVVLFLFGGTHINKKEEGKISVRIRAWHRETIKKWWSKRERPNGASRRGFPSVEQKRKEGAGWSVIFTDQRWRGTSFLRLVLENGRGQIGRVGGVHAQRSQALVVPLVLCCAHPYVQNGRTTTEWYVYFWLEKEYESNTIKVGV